MKFDEISVDDLVLAVENICTRVHIDVGAGMGDPVISEVPVIITPQYKNFLDEAGRDVLVSQPKSALFSRVGTGKLAVQYIVRVTTHLVENLLSAGVPRDVALKLLPHEIYEALQAQDSIDVSERK